MVNGDHSIAKVIFESEPNLHNRIVLIFSKTTPFTELDDPDERNLPLPVTYIAEAANKENYRKIKQYLRMYKKGIDGERGKREAGKEEGERESG